MKKIVFISDTHNQTHPVEDGDYLLHCGDLTMMGRAKEYKRAFEWLNSLPHKHKAIVFGNHDFSHELKYVDKSYIGDVKLLYPGQVHQVGELKIAAFPFVTELNSWAYNHTEETISRLVKEFVDSLWKEKIDVLMTHSPPYGILDDVIVDKHVGMNYYGHVGVKAYSGLAKKIGASVHAFGHIHEEGGNVKHFDDVYYVNACVLDEQYRKRSNDPWGVCFEMN